MGQQCCSASENSPQIVVTHEDLREQTTLDNNKSKETSKREAAEQSQKQKFYGKDGHKYSKTVTKEMASQIDSHLEEYKNKIFSKQSTILEVIEESSNGDAEVDTSRPSDAVDNFLDGLAEEISQIL